ncbi:response regulator aspartate phosphatase [Bacillus pumilus]|nr:hypothetical protein [Bacillus pumilus]
MTYDEVAIKLNEWYSAIKKDQITDAEFLKADSLLDFRHDLMLSYVGN